MISKERALEVLDFVGKNGVESAAENYDVSTDTVFRYLRIARKDIDYGGAPLPKILFFDLETSPLLGNVWSLWKQNVDALSQLERDWFVLCFSAKWMGEDAIVNASVDSKEVLVGDDSRVIKKLWDLFNEADVIVAHNAIKFDRKKANTRFLINGLLPPSPYRIIDTLASVKKEFAFSSNRMDFINKTLGLERKIDTGGMSLWTRSMTGDAEALSDMQLYCDQDIVALESTYFAIAPWIRSNINLGVYNDLEVEQCTHCMSTNIEPTDKFQTTNVSKFRLYRCGDCGGWSKNRHSELTLGKRKMLLTSTT